jgi:hypothetical protein
MYVFHALIAIRDEAAFFSTPHEADHALYEQGVSSTVANRISHTETSSICETSRYRGIFARPSYVMRLRRTGWLGM